MRKKLTVCLGLVLAALLVTGLVAWFLPPAEPQLQVGMTDAEVETLLGQFDYADLGRCFSTLLSPAWKKPRFAAAQAYNTV